MTSQVTPLPWRVFCADPEQPEECSIWSADSHQVAGPFVRAADAAFIVNAANAGYDALLDAERRALAYQEFIAHTLAEYGERMPSQWKAHARVVLRGG